MSPEFGIDINKTEYEVAPSRFVTVHKLDNGGVALSHSLTLQQIYGDERLVALVDRIPNVSGSTQLRDIIGSLYPDAEARQLTSALMQDSFVIDSAKREENIFSYCSPETLKPSDYRLLRILLVDVCNLSCDYCKVMPNFVDVTKHAVKLEDLERGVNLFFEGSTSEKPKTIHISGGEPLVAWGSVKHIVQLAEERKRGGEQIKLVIGTNAMLVNEERAEFLAAHNVKAIVSMDGRQPIHDQLRVNHAGAGSFEEVDKGIRLLQARGVEVGLSVVVGRHNVANLSEEIGIMIDTYNPSSFGVNYMKPPTREDVDYPYLITPEEYVEATYAAFQKYRDTGIFFELVYRKVNPFVERRVRKYDCGAASGTTLNIDPKGNIGPCKSYLILNELATPVADLQRRKQVIQALQARSSLFVNECQGCKALGICGNGCAYEAEISSGDMGGIDQHACDYTQLFFDRFVNDLGDIVQPKLDGRSFYIPTQEDKEKILGNIVVDELTLKSSIGHFTD